MHIKEEKKKKNKKLTVLYPSMIVGLRMGSHAHIVMAAKFA